MRAVVLALLLVLSREASAEQWWLVVSPHFEVVSDASEETARSTAEELELIRAVFARAMPGFPVREGPKLPAWAARDTTSLRRLLPHLEERGRREIPSGLFWRTAHQNFIVLRADLRGDHKYEVVYHEYFHSLMNPAVPHAPLWLQEGFAGLWENTITTSSHVQTARPNGDYLAILKRGTLMPLPELLSIAVGDPEVVDDAHRSSMFYAQSWALTHYIMFGDDQDALRPRLSAYLSAVNRGGDSLEAFEAELGPVETFEKALAHYVRRLQFTALEIDRPDVPDAADFAVRRLSEGEIAARLAHYYAMTQRHGEAASHVRAALTFQPEAALALETAGYLAYLEGDRSAAREHFERARQRDGSRPLTFYFLAQMRAETLVTIEDLDFVRESFERAAALDPSHAPSLSRLSLLYRGDSDKRDTALELSGRARSLAPADPVAHTAYGIALKQAGRLTESVAALETALRLDPSSQLAREELEEVRAAAAFPLFGVWQYESFQLWLRVDGDGGVVRCRVDTDGTLYRDEGRIEADTLSWSDGARERIELDGGRLVLESPENTVRFDRSFVTEGPCGAL